MGFQSDTRRIFSAAELAAVWPAYDDEEEKALLRVIRSGLWCRLKDSDWRTGESGLFERELSEFLGVPHTLAMCNGTEAIDLALRALNVGAGDEILVQASTYFGTVTPIVRNRAIPVFVDFAPGKYSIDIDCLESRITSRSKVVVVAHLAGICPNMDRLVDVCNKHDLKLVEDCAQAFGSFWASSALGTIGDVGTFSFQQDKALNCGEGGAVVTRDADLFGRLFAFHQGFPIKGVPGHARTEISTNLRITPWQTAILRCQLRRVCRQMEHRLANFERLLALLGDDSPLIPFLPQQGQTKWSIYASPMRYISARYGGRSRDEFLAMLSNAGVPCFEGHVEPLYMRPVFIDNEIQHRNDGCPVSESLARQEAVTIMQWFYLGPAEWMDRFANLIRNW